MFTIKDLQQFVDPDSKIEGNKSVVFDNVKTATEAGPSSMTWIKKTDDSAEKLLKETKASVIVCSEDINVNQDILKQKLLIKCASPKLVFSKIVNKLFIKKPVAGIHPSAYVNPGARLGKDIYVGPNAVIEAAEIGDNCVIHGNVYIFEHVKIGDRVTVFPGTVIGADGFGYSRADDGSIEKFPHVGGVVIGSDVEIGSNTSIDRGSLGNTIIEEGVKIDNLVHVAHNVRIGAHTMVVANSLIGGSTVIGKGSYLAPSATVLNALNLGMNVLVGTAAVITKNVPDGETWAGNPARELKEFLRINKKIKDL